MELAIFSVLLIEIVQLVVPADTSLVSKTIDCQDEGITLAVVTAITSG
jgi:hypothetical protein